MNEIDRAEEESLKKSHDIRDVNSRAIFILGVVIIVIAALIHFSVWGVFRYLEKSEEAAGKERVAAPLILLKEKLPPEPRLQPNPGWDLDLMRQSEEKELNNYSWSDQNRGTVNLPIDRAKDLLLQKGLPARSQEESVGLRDRGLDIPSDSSSGRASERRLP